MAEYKAIMPCRFGGKDYRPGDNIPVGVFPEKQAAELALMGLIEIKESRFVDTNKTVEPDKMSELEEKSPASQPEEKPKRRKRKAAKE